MAGYGFKFLQSLGHVTHAKNLVANVAFSRANVAWTHIFNGSWTTLATARIVFPGNMG